MSRFGWFFVLIAVLLTATPFVAKKAIGGGNATLSVMLGNELCEMDIEEYVLRVLISEGQKCQSAETKKALAVAARSCGMYFALYGMKHGDFDVCSSAECCLPLGDPKTASAKQLSEASAAVRETKGIILTLNKLPAMALFTLCASEGTRYCEEFEYITPIKNEEKCEKHITVLEYGTLELSHALQCEKLSDCLFVYGENGKCAFAIAEHKQVQADFIVSALSLPSYEFEAELSNESAVFTVYGAGHGCGLDLCAADKLASNGYGYEKILLFYFPNLEINKIYNA